MRKVALLLDGLNIKDWQYRALSYADDCVDIVCVISCVDTHRKRTLKIRNFLYYVLNFFTIRRATQNVTYDASGIEVIKFRPSPGFKKRWESLPSAIVEQLEKKGVTTIVKFGMGLLDVTNLSGIDVLSYHHGDPSRYRGRPAGFYELLNGDLTVGAIVQRLSNKLDGGVVLAKAYSKVYPHSYCSTLRNHYSNSTYLLKSALLGSQGDIEQDSSGHNYKLPSNYIVFMFCVSLFKHKVTRLLYGSFCFKHWSVAIGQGRLILDKSTVLRLDGTEKLHDIVGYQFLADPFFSRDGSSVLVEAMSKSTGLGEILSVKRCPISYHRLLYRGGHYSFPIQYDLGASRIIVPEVGGFSSPCFYSAGGKKIGYLKGLENLRVADLVIHNHGSKYFAFFGVSGTANEVLHLAVGSSLAGPYRMHPMSPIRISPFGARMAGKIFFRDGQLFRFGQNFIDGYGNGIVVFSIDVITEDFYKETFQSSISVEGSKGPHTLDFCNNEFVFDYYTDRFSLLAGVRRARAKLLRLFRC